MTKSTRERIRKTTTEKIVSGTLSINQIIDKLGFLSQDNLKELVKRANFLIIEEVKSSCDREESFFYDALTLKLRTELRIPTDEFHKFKLKTTSYKMFLKAFKFLNKYLRNILEPKTPTRYDKQRFYALYADLMYNYQLSTPYPITMITLMTAYELFPSILDKEMPDFISGGLGWLILNPKELHPDAEGGNLVREDEFEEMIEGSEWSRVFECYDPYADEPILEVRKNEKKESL